MSRQITMNQFVVSRNSRFPTSPPAKRTDTKATPKRSSFAGRGRGGGRDSNSYQYSVLQDAEEDLDIQDTPETSRSRSIHHNIANPSL
jgi:hypothetical protein